MFSNPVFLVLVVVLTLAAWRWVSDKLRHDPSVPILTRRRFYWVWLRNIPQSRSFTTVLALAGVWTLFVAAGWWFYNDIFGHTVPTRWERYMNAIEIIPLPPLILVTACRCLVAPYEIYHEYSQAVAKRDEASAINPRGMASRVVSRIRLPWR